MGALAVKCFCLLADGWCLDLETCHCQTMDSGRRSCHQMRRGKLGCCWMGNINLLAEVFVYSRWGLAEPNVVAVLSKKVGAVWTDGVVLRRVMSSGCSRWWWWWKLVCVG